MSRVVDTRGLICPRPFLMTIDEIKKVSQGQIEILVDSDSSKENIGRAAESKGWVVKDVKKEGEGYRVTIYRG